MSLTAKALFVIERNLQHELTLDSIATACGVSHFHLSHAFSAATSRTVKDYVRARRLSEAARVLANGASNILEVALSSGYGSHEAFSRAFRAQFDLTPEDLRKRGALDGIPLTEVMMVTPNKSASLTPPRFESVGELRFVGLAKDRALGEAAKIPAQWQEFMSGPYQRIPGKMSGAPVGVTLPKERDDEFVYVCAAPVSKFGGTPQGLTELIVAPATYAVFEHNSHVSELPRTYMAIWNDWFPASGRKPLRAASLEHHNDTFDPRTGMGGVTVWIPVE